MVHIHCCRLPEVFPEEAGLKHGNPNAVKIGAGSLPEVFPEEAGLKLAVPTGASDRQNQLPEVFPEEAGLKLYPEPDKYRCNQGFPKYFQRKLD